MHFQSLEHLEEFMELMFASGKIIWVHLGDSESFLAEVLDYDSECLHVRKDNGRSWKFIWRVVQASQASPQEAEEFRNRLARSQSDAASDS